MSLRFALALGLLAAPFAGLAAMPAPQADDAMGTMINDPNPSTFQVYGVTPAPRSIRDDTVQGGRSLHVPVTGSGTPYAVGVNVPIIQPVKAGDHLTLMFFAKLEKPAEGITTARIAGQIQLAGAPYTAMFSKQFDMTMEWKLYSVDGIADKDYAKGTLNAAFHINTGRQTVALGLVAVFAKPK